MNSTHSTIFSSLYDWISISNPFVAHSTIGLYLKHHSIPLVQDSIITHFHQELLRRIHHSKIINHPLVTENDIIQSKKKRYTHIVTQLMFGLLFSLCFIPFASIYVVIVIYFLFIIMNTFLLSYIDLEYSCLLSIIIILIFYFIYKRNH